MSWIHVTDIAVRLSMKFQNCFKLFSSNIENKTEAESNN